MPRLIDADALDMAFTNLRFNKDMSLAHWGDRKDWCLHGHEVEKLIHDAPTIGGWISVKDRMPEPEEKVIIWTKTDCMRYAQYHDDGSNNPWYVYEDDARAWTNVITHWMPLPEPPKE